MFKLFYERDDEEYGIPLGQVPELPTGDDLRLLWENDDEAVVGCDLVAIDLETRQYWCANEDDENGLHWERI